MASNPTGASIRINPPDEYVTVTQPVSRTYDPGTTVALTANAMSGYTFVKWQKAGVDYSGSASTSVAVDADFTMTAVYTPIVRTLSVQSSPVSGVSITVSPSDNDGKGNGTTNFTRLYNNGTNVTLTAPLSVSGYTFLKWQKDTADYSTDASISVTVNANFTMKAVYGQTRTLTVASNPSGASIRINQEDVSVTTPVSRSYVNGTMVFLMAYGWPGYTFVKWQKGTVDYSTQASISVTVDANFTMTAVYMYTPAVRTLSVQSSGASAVPITVSPSDNGGQGNGTTDFTRSYNNGTNVTLTAPTSVSGATFSTWTKNGSNVSGNPVTVQMDANYTLVAVYVPVVRTLSVQSSGASAVPITVSPNDNGGQGNGTTNFTRSYNNGQNVSLTAPTSVSGATFMKWQKNGADVLPANPATSVTMDNNYMMTAVYQRINNPPTAVQLTFNPEPSEHGRPTDFAAVCTDPDVGDTLSYSLQFGDDGSVANTSSGTHAFTRRGNIQVTLTCTDNHGAVSLPLTVYHLVIADMVFDTDWGPGPSANVSNGVVANKNLAGSPVEDVLMSSTRDGFPLVLLTRTNGKSPGTAPLFFDQLWGNNTCLPASWNLSGGFAYSCAAANSLAGQVPAAMDVAVADMDGDGHQDIVVCGRDAGYPNVVLRNRGSDRTGVPAGTPDNLNEYDIHLLESANGARCHDVALLDLDGNGKPELVVISNRERIPSENGSTFLSAPGSRIYVNNSTPGSMSFSSLVLGGSEIYANAVAAVNILGDAKKELLLAREGAYGGGGYNTAGANMVLSCVNNCLDGRYQAVANAAVESVLPGFFELGNTREIKASADGSLIVVARTGVYDENRQQVLVWQPSDVYRKSGSVYARTALTGTGNVVGENLRVFGVDLSDADGDGRLDIYLVTHAGRRIVRQTAGGFTDYTPINPLLTANGSCQNAVAAYDFDGDLYPEFLSASGGNNGACTPGFVRLLSDQDGSSSLLEAGTQGASMGAKSFAGAK